MGWALIALAVLLFLIGIGLFKKGKETVITYVISGVLILCAGVAFYFGFDNVNNTPHTYTVTQNVEISSGHYKIVLEKEGGGKTILPSVDAEQAKDFPENTTVVFSDSELSKYRD